MFSMLEMGLGSQEHDHTIQGISTSMTSTDQASVFSWNPTGLLFLIQRGPVPHSNWSELASQFYAVG